MDGPGANLERLLSRCGKQGHAEPLTFRAKFHALNQFQKTTVRPAMVLKLGAGNRGTKKKCSMPLKRKLPGTTKPIKKQRGQNPAEQARFSKLCKAGQQASSLFATLPCDEKKLRMTIYDHYHSTKSCCICTVYIFFVGVPWFSGVFSKQMIGQMSMFNA